MRCIRSSVRRGFQRRRPDGSLCKERLCRMDRLVVVCRGSGEQRGEKEYLLLAVRNERMKTLTGHDDRVFSSLLRPVDVATTETAIFQWDIHVLLEDHVIEFVDGAEGVGAWGWEW